ncbi:hypothetical protein F5I97DRAFT_923860 [Phlebopus sp. FC_14]|nr:hypothetical protein F5I97DRAFT_923860 [Phlebopus sp. FC_14]
MAALPSFIQLMASLGLDGDAKPSPPQLTTSRPRSDSCSSVSSTSTDRDCSPTSPSFNRSSESLSRDMEFDRRPALRLRSARYSPYVPTSNLQSSARQNSSISLAPSVEEPDSGRRSTSPRLSSSPSRRRPSSLHVIQNGRELHASTPISSYVRRKTPQNSPTAATFPQRIHVERPETIILPSLIISWGLYDRATSSMDRRILTYLIRHQQASSIAPTHRGLTIFTVVMD